MNPASRATHLSEIRAPLLFYMKNYFVFIWATSQSGQVRSHLELDGISVKWDENFPYERPIPRDRMEIFADFTYIDVRHRIL